MGALSDGGAGHGGHSDCLASDDLGHLFTDQAGDPARLSATDERDADLAEGDWPDLHSRGELGVACRDSRGDHRVWLLDEARLGLRRGGDGHDAGYNDTNFLRHYLLLRLQRVVVRC